MSHLTHLKKHSRIDQAVIQDHFGAWAFKSVWDVFWVATAFTLQQALEESVEIYEPEASHARASVHWGVSIVLLVLYMLLRFSTFHIIAHSDSSHRIELEKMEETSEHMSSMTLDSATGELQKPTFPFWTVLIATLQNILWLFTALSVTKSVTDTVEIYHKDPSHLRAGLYWALSSFMLFLFIVGNYAIPKMMHACKSNDSKPEKGTKGLFHEVVHVEETRVTTPTTRQRSRTGYIGPSRSHASVRGILMGDD